MTMNGKTDRDIVAPRFARFLLDNAELERLADGCRWTEGPVWMGDWNCLLFQDLPNRRTLRWAAGEGASDWRYPSCYGNGQTRDREGRLIVCSHGGRCLQRVEFDGAVTTLVDEHDGKRLNSPNDVVAHSDGSLWFTDPIYGISNDYEGGRQQSEQPPAVYRFDPTDASIRIVSRDFAGPTGIAFSPDETRLYVAETGDQTRADPEQLIRGIDVSGGKETAGDARDFHAISPGYCDGMTVDEEGFIWSSAADGVHCLSPDGELLGKVLVPNRVSNVTFGGAARNRLFITGGKHLHAIYTNRRGARQPCERSLGGLERDDPKDP